MALGVRVMMLELVEGEEMEGKGRRGGRGREVRGGGGGGNTRWGMSEM